MCAGIEMCLRSGIRIHVSYYSDNRSAAQRVAQHRVNETTHPALLHTTAVQYMWDTPQDVWDVCCETLQQLVQRHAGSPWRVGGFECQDRMYRQLRRRPGRQKV